MSKSKKIRVKSTQIDERTRRSSLYVQPDDLVEAIVEVSPGNVVITEPMPARDVPREGEIVEIDQ